MYCLRFVMSVPAMPKFGKGYSECYNSTRLISKLASFGYFKTDVLYGISYTTEINVIPAP